MSDSVFVRLSCRAAPRLRLICFPHGGGGPSAYRQWPARLPQSVEPWAVCLPGREMHAHQPCVDSVDALVALLAEDAQRLPPMPYVLFGHSLGAALAVELTAALRRMNASLPLKLVLTGRAPPHSPYPVDMRQASDEALTQALIDMGGVPAQLAAAPGYLAAFLPRIRADYRLNHDVLGRIVEPLDLPLTVINGCADPFAKRADIEAWREYTRREFRSLWVDGGHFFLHEQVDYFIELLLSELANVEESVASR